MHYVYILESEAVPARFYVGVTSDVDRRVNEHNAGKSVHTNKFKPWTLSICIGFSDRAKALRLEQDLKSGSGRAFAKKHF